MSDSQPPKCTCQKLGWCIEQRKGASFDAHVHGCARLTYYQERGGAATLFAL